MIPKISSSKDTVRTSHLTIQPMLVSQKKKNTLTFLKKTSMSNNGCAQKDAFCYRASQFFFWNWLAPGNVKNLSWCRTRCLIYSKQRSYTLIDTKKALDLDGEENLGGEKESPAQYKCFKMYLNSTDLNNCDSLINNCHTMINCTDLYQT